MLEKRKLIKDLGDIHTFMKYGSLQEGKKEVSKEYLLRKIEEWVLIISKMPELILQCRDCEYVIPERAIGGGNKMTCALHEQMPITENDHCCWASKK